MRQKRGDPVKIKLETIYNKGRGVVATTTIETGELIECCPVILFHLEKEILSLSGLGYFYYEWDDDFEAIVLGYGSLYNHSFEPNTQFVRDYIRHIMNFIAVKPIAAGEEITINYNYYPGDYTPMAFEVF